MDKAPLEIDFSRGTLCIAGVLLIIALILAVKNNKEK